MEGAKSVKINGKRLLYNRFRIKESNIFIKTDEEAFYPAVEAALTHRVELERYLEREPKILWTLEPMDAGDDAPQIIKKMCSAAKIADVGPMAAVAGALADLIAEAAVNAGASGILVEDGGELFADGEYSFTVSVGAGRSPVSQKIGFRLTPDIYPVGVATSSATVGHAISFGMADAVTVISRNAALADALATSICNSTKGRTHGEAVEAGIRAAKDYSEVRGVLIIVGDKVGVMGDIPELLTIDGEV